MRAAPIKLAIQVGVTVLLIYLQTTAKGQANVLEQQRAISALRKAGAEVSAYRDETGTAGLSVVVPGISPLAVPPRPGLSGNRSAEARIDYSVLRHLKSVPHLRRLEVRFLESDGSTLGNVRSLKELRSLSIELCDLKAKPLSGLKDLPQLREFTLNM
jgi:hypothetical protein